MLLEDEKVETRDFTGGDGAALYRELSRLPQTQVLSSERLFKRLDALAHIEKALTNEVSGERAVIQ